MINNKNPNNWGTSHLGRKEKIESKAAIETYPRNCLINEFRVNVKKCQTKDWAEQIKLSMIYRVHGIMSLPRVCLPVCPIGQWSSDEEFECLVGLLTVFALTRVTKCQLMESGKAAEIAVVLGER